MNGGAVAYLSYSKYGIGNGNGSSKNYINNVNYNATVTTSNISGSSTGVYAVTGYAGEKEGDNANTLTATMVLEDSVIGSSSYVSYAWYTTNGQLNSTTGNIYGIYDMSGGQKDNVSAYVSYGSLVSTLKTYGAAFATGTSTKYATAYKTSDITISNYSVNESFYMWTLLNGYFGDGIYEISSLMELTITGNYGLWNACQNADTSNLEPFFDRGGDYGGKSNAGLFALSDNNGYSSYWFGRGFHAILIFE